MSDIKAKQQAFKEALFKETGCEYYVAESLVVGMFAPSMPMSFTDQRSSDLAIKEL